MKAKRSRKAASVLLRGENVSLILFPQNMKKHCWLRKLWWWKRAMSEKILFHLFFFDKTWKELTETWKAFSGCLDTRWRPSAAALNDGRSSPRLPRTRRCPVGAFERDRVGQKGKAFLSSMLWQKKHLKNLEQRSGSVSSSHSKASHRKSSRVLLMTFLVDNVRWILIVFQFSHLNTWIIHE